MSAPDAPPPSASPSPYVGKMARPAQGASWRGRLRRLAADALPDAWLVRKGSPRGKRVALTFDDGPHELTDAYLDVLERFGARATFFVVGEACVPRRDVLLRLVAAGHQLAGHGFTHTPFTKLGARALDDELRRTAALLPPVRTGRALVRPPTGATSVRSLARCARAGYSTVLWSRDSDDCRTSSPDQVAARVAPEIIRPGDIVLLHEAQSWTLAALPQILKALRDADWQTVTVGHMLES